MLWIMSNIYKYREDYTSSTTINSKDKDFCLDNLPEQIYITNNFKQHSYMAKENRLPYHFIPQKKTDCQVNEVK